MKKALLGIQVVFSLIFILVLVVSFTHFERIATESRELVTEKVAKGAASKVGLAEEVLHTKVAESVLKPYQIETALEEISLFNSNPELYVESVVNEKSSVLSKPVVGVSNPLKRALLEKIFSWKVSLKEHFQSTLSQLVIDIRIFLISNVLGLLVAAFVIFKSENVKSKKFAVGVIVTFVIAVSSVTYLDRNWLYAILLKDYAGYGYPLSIIMSSLWLCYEYFRERGVNA